MHEIKIMHYEENKTTATNMVSLGKQVIDKLARIKANTDVIFSSKKENDTCSIQIVFYYNGTENKCVTLYEFFSLDKNKSILSKAIAAIKNNSVLEFKEAENYNEN